MIRKEGNYTLEKAVNFPQNQIYLELRRNKFWDIVQAKRRKFEITNADDASAAASIDEYIKVNGRPPFSAFRIKNTSAYTHMNVPEPSDEKSSTYQVEDSKPVPVPTPESDVLSVLNMAGEDPLSLLVIPQKEQELRSYTSKDKIAPPMYASSTTIEEDHTSDKLDIKQDGRSYAQKRIVAPPEYPFTYYRLKKGQKCPHCHRVGKNCHNIRYGMFLAAVVSRYHRENKSIYNEHDAAMLFIETYHNLREFEDYIDSFLLDENTSCDLPECIQFDSLVFALNSVEWEIMWSTAKRVKAPARAEK